MKIPKYFVALAPLIITAKLTKILFTTSRSDINFILQLRKRPHCIDIHTIFGNFDVYILYPYKYFTIFAPTIIVPFITHALMSKNPLLNILKRVSLLSIICCVGVSSWASPVSPEDAKTEAISFFKNRSELSATRTTNPLTLECAYREGTDEAPYFYIYSDKEANCFAIVSGDTRLPGILGYSLTSPFDAQNMPCNVKWWLSEYSAQIQSFLKNDPEEKPATRAIIYDTSRKPVAPMLTTTWNQTAPYNNLCPQVNGSRSVTGCIATSMAQTMKYYNWPPEGTGSRNDYSFERTYDWTKMLNEYPKNGYKPAEADAVATLMLSCGKSVDMVYSPYASGAYSYKIQYALPTYFDYSKEVRHLIRDFYNQAEWNEIIYREMEAGRPVIYGGQSSEGGHSFVCDGYSEDGYFHINWGWGGLSDGYFLLNALTPDENGVGGYEGGYNLNQTALINIKKNEGEGEMQKLMICTGAFVYMGNIFMVQGDSGMSSGIMYNALEDSMFVYAGVKVIGENGNLVGYVTDPDGALLEAYHGFGGFQLNFPKMEDGIYHLYPVFKTEDSDWMPILVPYGLQQYVLLSVEDGKMKFSNPGVPESMKTKLIASDIHVSPFASKDCQATFRCFISNIGGSDYVGDVIIKILDSNNDPAIEFTQPVSLPAQTSTSFVSQTLMDIQEGEYTVELYDSEKNLITEPSKMVLGNTIKPVTQSGNVRFDITGPGFVQGSCGGISLNVRNLSSSYEQVELIVRLLTSDGSKVLTENKFNRLMIPGNYRGPYNLNVMLTSSVGDWLVDLTDGEGNPLCSPFPMTVVGPVFEVNEVCYSMVDNENAFVAAPYMGKYTGTVSPVSDETFYTVTGIEGNAFTLSPTVTEVVLPETVNNIPAASFYGTKNLEMITMNAPVPGKVSSWAMPEEKFSEVILNVPMESANIYKRTQGWAGFNIPGWKLSIQNTLSVISGLLRNDAGEIYNPYYIKSGKTLDFEVQVPEKCIIRITLTTPDGKVEKINSVDGKISLPSLRKGVGQAIIEVIKEQSAVELLADAEVLSPVYDLNGLCVKDKCSQAELLTLSPGLYIWNNQLIVVE